MVEQILQLFIVYIVSPQTHVVLIVNVNTFPHGQFCKYSREKKGGKDVASML